MKLFNTYVFWVVYVGITLVVASTPFVYASDTFWYPFAFMMTWQSIFMDRYKVGNLSYVTTSLLSAAATIATCSAADILLRIIN